MRAPEGTRVIADKKLKMARAARSYREPSSEEIALARHMAHAGATLKELHAALRWCGTETGTYNKLRRLNIRPNSKRAHRGFETSIPPRQIGVAWVVYKPKQVAS